MSKKTLALIIILLLASIVLVILAINPKTPQQPVKPGPTPTPTPDAHTTLMIMPSPVVLSPGGLGRADIELNSHGNLVTTVQLEIKYDPNVLTNVDITPGPFFKQPTKLKKIDTATGHVQLALWIDPKQSPVNGEGVVATLTFSKKFGISPTIRTTSLSFLPKTQVTAQGISGSVLSSLSGTSVVLSTVGVTNQVQPSLTQKTPVIPSKTVIPPTTSTRSAQ